MDWEEETTPILKKFRRRVREIFGVKKDLKKSKTWKDKINLLIRHEKLIQADRLTPRRSSSVRRSFNRKKRLRNAWTSRRSSSIRRSNNRRILLMGPPKFAPPNPRNFFKK
jgi:hypothetical protein